MTVDNLMTHDKVTFKDLMTKVASISQTGSLSLFSSKEQELEQRALLLKRLAFVIFCSDVDQYQKQMPEIQGEDIKLAILNDNLNDDLYFLRTIGRESSHHSNFACGPICGLLVF